MDEIKSIGIRIREAREQAGLSLEQLADQLGVSFQSVQQWEAGKTSPRPHRIKKIAETLKKSSVWIQFGESTAQQGVEEKNSGEIYDNEHREQVIKSFSTSLETLIKYGWIQVTKPDVGISIITDIFRAQIENDQRNEIKCNPNEK